MKNYCDTLAPIVLFVYNRPWHTQRTIEALQHNNLAKNSVLYVFADGAKPNATDEQLERICKTREIIRSISGFKRIHIIESENNKGLADSIVSGVSRVVNEYGRVIVLEDDIVTSKFFLEYMNCALCAYEDEPQVMHVSGYMYPLKKNNLPDTFFYPATSCWGWATWKRAWACFNPDAEYLYDQIKKRDLLGVLNINTIHGFEKQLIENIEGKLHTWFIKWNASVILEGGYSLYPKYSLVQNVGFDGSGEHCGRSGFLSVPFKQVRIKVKRQVIEFDQNAIQALKEFDVHNPSSTISLKKYLRRVVKKCFPVFILNLFQNKSVEETPNEF